MQAQRGESKDFSELDLLRQENARLISRIKELEQSQAETDKLIARITELEHAKLLLMNRRIYFLQKIFHTLQQIKLLLHPTPQNSIPDISNDLLLQRNQISSSVPMLTLAQLFDKATVAEYSAICALLTISTKSQHEHTSLCQTSNSSELLIKNESNIDALIILLRQKFKMSEERLEQWRANIAFELRDNKNYWKKERESMSEANFLEHKQNFEAKMGVPTTPHKKELKNRSLALIEYA